MLRHIHQPIEAFPLPDDLLAPIIGLQLAGWRVRYMEIDDGYIAHARRGRSFAWGRAYTVERAVINLLKDVAAYEA